MNKNKEFYIQSYIFNDLKNRKSKGLYKYEWNNNIYYSQEINNILKKCIKKY